MDELEEAIECMCANLNLAHFSRVFKNRLGYRRTNTAIRCLENRSKSTIIRKKYDSAEEKCEKNMPYILIARIAFGSDFWIKRHMDRKYARYVVHPGRRNKILIEKYYNRGAALNFLAKNRV